MPKAERRLTVIGGTSVGKSALTIRFIENKFSEDYEPTIARVYHHDTNYNGTDYSLTVYDTAGLEPQSQIPENYINSHGFILVYSIADKQSFEIVRDIYHRLVEELLGPNMQLVLIGNKSDLNEQRKITYEDGKRLITEWKKNGTSATFMETSALTGDKVADVFYTILNSIEQTTQNQPMNGQQNNGAGLGGLAPSKGDRVAAGNKGETKCVIS